MITEPTFDVPENTSLTASSWSGGPPAWLLGCHGTIAVSAFAAMRELGAEPPSYRSMALARRTRGTERMATLTDLPSLHRPLVIPTNENGALGIGVVERVAEPTVVWPADESLPNYIDRRLPEAGFLYLPNRGLGYAFAKRLVDLVGSAVLLLVAAPIMIVLSLLIRMDSPGPALFAQQRITRGGRLFTFYKFRTMWVDAKDRFPELYDYQKLTARPDVYYKLSDDPRSTRVGRWLRRTTLDELPNLINVLLGDMTLVGPRPELPGLVPLYRPEDLVLFFTKSGVTGLAQVAGRSLLTVRERIALDLRYVANQTVLLDLRILLCTVSAVLLRRGAF